MSVGVKFEILFCGNKLASMRLLWKFHFEVSLKIITKHGRDMVTILSRHFLQCLQTAVKATNRKCCASGFTVLVTRGYDFIIYLTCF